MSSPPDLRQALPQVDRLVRDLHDRPTCGALSPAVLTGLVESAISELREKVASKQAGLQEIQALPDAVESRAAALLAAGPRAVINATGVLIHTNLGRAPLGELLDEEARRAMSGYSTLEFDLASGQRGKRDDFFVPHLQALFPGCSALAVNNCAAAMLLALNTFSAGKETILSRGELIEIGEGFRVPDIFSASGAKLCEVGTTNRTRLADYEDAINADSALLLRVHRSNFTQSGFVESTSTHDLARLAAQRTLVSGVDLGGGLLAAEFLPVAEETVQENLAAGADFIAFSGDKLFGGPQAGIVVGKPGIILRMRKNPLYRALRLGKQSVLLLNGTLRNYLRGQLPPALTAAALPAEELRRRCEILLHAAEHNTGLKASIVAGESRVGGGAAPDAVLPTPEISLSHSRLSPDKFLAVLRANDPPIIARIIDNAVRLNPRTLLNEEEIEIVTRCIAGLS